MGRHPTFTDDVLLRRASDRLWKDGCPAVSIRDLESSMGVKAPSIYRRFGSRNELLARAIDSYTARVVEGRLDRYLGDGPDPLAGLRAFFESVRVPVGRESRPRGCLLAMTLAQPEMGDPRIAASVLGGLAAIRRAFAGQLERAVQAGRLGPGVDTDALAESLVASLLGLLNLVRADEAAAGPMIEAIFASHFPVATDRKEPAHAR
ncbi:MAG: TetR/AcrR family transcriptional regulator [Acidobacteria bacterium]|nr:TetR/AcrR family transcriptional regulator [Acidobacteriota bacterium]